MMKSQTKCRLISPAILKTMGVVALMLLAYSTCHSQSARVGEIEIRVDPRVELLSTVCMLADFDEYRMANRYKPYCDEIIKHFDSFKTHKVIDILNELRVSDGISYNAPMGLAVYLKDIQSCRTRVPFDRIPEDLDKRWTPENVSRLLPELKDFAEVTRYQDSFNSHSDLNQSAVGRVANILKNAEIVPWFDRFFGRKPGYTFQLIIGLQNGAANYGAQVTLTDGPVEMYSVVGCHLQDGSGLPLFDETFIPIVIHEFCHSYTDPIVDKYAGCLEETGSRIFEKVKEKMIGNAYGDWSVMIKESFVRACVLRFLDQKVDKSEWQQDLDRNRKIGFLWVGQLSEKIKEYQNNRSEYQKFDDFIPQIAEFFSSYVDQIDQDLSSQKDQEKEKWEQIRQEGPRIAQMIPANGALNVDPGLTEIRITFDREMDPAGFCVLYDPIEQDMFPELTGTSGFDAAKRTYIMPVRLKPDWNYTFSLNSKKMIGFKDSKGTPLYPVLIRFKTRSK